MIAFVFTLLAFWFFASHSRGLARVLLLIALGLVVLVWLGRGCKRRAALSCGSTLKDRYDRLAECSFFPASRLNTSSRENLENRVTSSSRDKVG